MACLWCLNKCVALEEPEESKDEPLVDLVKILQGIAWKTIRSDPPRALTLSDRLCGLRKVLKLEVDTSFININHPDALKLKPRPTTGQQTLPAPTGQPDGSTFLFQSQFDNDTGTPQTYSFKTERQTRSAMEMSIQRGFTLGQELELEVKVPSEVAGCEVSGKLGGQLQWSFTRGKVSRQEEQVTWAVDSHVQVSANSTGVATLAVKECRWTADFSLNCVIQPRPCSGPMTSGQKVKNETSSSEEEEEEEEDKTQGSPQAGSAEAAARRQRKRPAAQAPKFPVFVRRRATNELLQIINVPCSAVVRARPGHFSKSGPNEPYGVACTLHGQCHVVCAVNQRVWLKEAQLVTRPGRPAIVHQDSVIIRDVS